MWLLLIRGLQIASLLLGLFGAGNAVQLGGNIYGSGEATATDWLSTLMPLVAAAASWAGSQFLGIKVTTPSLTELVAAAVAFGKDRTEQNRLRLIVATISILKEIGGLEHLHDVAKSLDSCARPPQPAPSPGVFT